MDQEPDVIRRQIGETRSALTEKLETLECQVRETVTSAKTSVDETIENVRSTVRDTVEGVKQTLDITYQTRRHPWALFGGSVAAGFLVGTYLHRPSHSRRPLELPRTTNGNGFRSMATAEPAPAPRETYQEESKPGFLSDLLHQFDDEIQTAKQVAIGAAVGWLRDMAKESLPQLAPHIDEVMNSAAIKLGGKPIHRSMVEPEAAPAWQRRTA